MNMFPYTDENVLRGQSVSEWEDVTGAHVHRNIIASEEVPDIFDLEVFASINYQNIPTAIIVGGSTRGRRLQQEVELPPSAQRLDIEFNVLLRYRTTNSEIDNDALVYNAFDKVEERENYVQWLKDTSTVFSGIQDVEVRIDGFEPPAPAESNGGNSDDDGNDGLNLAVIIGAAVGGAALIFLIAFIFFKCRSSKKEVRCQRG